MGKKSTVSDEQQMAWSWEGAAPGFPLRSRYGRLAAHVAPLIALLPVLGLAAFLRCYALPQRGLIYWDEGKFALEGVRLHMALLWFVGHHVSIAGGKAVGTAKPSHALLIALAYLVFGVHDYAPLLLNALAGVVEVAVTYALARLLFDPLVGLLGALFLAVSEYDVIYSRSALSESDANALLLIGVLLWVLGRSRGGGRCIERLQGSRAALLLSGLAMGAGFSTNYRLIVYIGVLVGLDLGWAWYEIGPGEAVRRMPWWVAGLIVAPGLWQLVDVIARMNGLALFRSEATLKPVSYLSEVIYQLHQGKQSMVHFSPAPYLVWFVVRQGWLMFALVLCGIALAFGMRSFAWLAMAIPVVIPYAVYVFAPFIVPRNLDPVLPFTSILAAAFLVTVARKVRSRRLATAVTLIVALVVAGMDARMSWRLTAERSGFARAAAFVERQGGAAGERPEALTSSEVGVFYLSGMGAHCTALSLPHSVPEIAADVAAGYRYAVLDHFSWKASQFVHRRMPLQARYPAFGRVFLGENPIASENTHLPDQNAQIPYVNVYRLLAERLPAPRGEAQVCDLDKV